MEKKLKILSKKVNFYLNNYLSKFNYSELKAPMKYGLFPGGKKIRSKIIFDVGSIFNVKKKHHLDNLIFFHLGAFFRPDPGR